MSTTWYCYYQLEPESRWFPILAEHRQRIVKEKGCPFTSVLELDHPIDENTTPEEVAKTHYRGPFYQDLDSDDPELVIVQFKKLLRMLRDEYDVDLEQIALYATGGRGFHLEFAPEMFCKPNPRGQSNLPLIYREMANQLYVDTVDMNIYSARRGRMWREPNVQRTNGRYKVPISVQEAMEMTVDKYIAITSQKRHERFTKAPALNSALAVLYSSAASKLASAVESAKKNRNAVNLLKDFGGEIPPSFRAAMSGEVINSSIGFQKIATQLAITAAALTNGDGTGMTRDQFLFACEGLIHNHQGDGSRYNTPAKRRRELLRMYDYMLGNPCYSYSLGGLKSILVKGTRTPDLEMGKAAVNEAGEFIEGEDEQAAEALPYSVTQGLRISRQGIFKKSDEGGYTQVSVLGLADPKQLVDLNTGEVHGYEVQVYVEGKPTGKAKQLGMNAFKSRNAFVEFTLSAASCSVSLTDAQVGALADIMRKQTEKEARQVYTVRREGIDVIALPDSRLDVIWADQFGVSSNHQVAYRLSGSMTENLSFRTDLRNAPALVDSPQTRQFFEQMFSINSTETIGRMFGWLLASFLCQPIRQLFGQFPFLAIYGQAGSGKSKTMHLLTQLHYYRQEPQFTSAMDATRFTYDELATCSGSIPFVLEEFKPREMKKDLLEKAKGILRSNYNGDGIGKGGISTTTGAGKLVLNKMANRSPIAVLAEAQVTQSALMERQVPVPMRPEDRYGREAQMDYCMQHREVLSGLGRLCIDAARAVDLNALRDQVRANVLKIREMVGSRADAADRPIFNMAIAVTGLEFGKQVMNQVFGGAFDAVFNDLIGAVMKKPETLAPKVMSEAAKVLSTMAYLTQHEALDERVHLRHGEDYLNLGTTIEMRLQNVYTKYVRFKKGMGEEALYDNFESFWAAMSLYTGTVDTKCVTSALKISPQTQVFSFSTQYMYKEGIEEFNTQ
jgi:hypothetical protein